MRHIVIGLVGIALALTHLPGCPKDEPTSPSIDEPVEATPISAAGIVNAVREHPVHRDESLTRAEALLSVTPLNDQVLVADLTWLELLPPSGPIDGAPIATGSASAPISAPPGNYRVLVSYRVGPLAVGYGMFGPITLEPASSHRLVVELSFKVGRILIEARRHDQELTDGVDLLVEPALPPEGEAAEGQGATLELGAINPVRWPLPLPLGQIADLQPGEYQVSGVWTDASGQTHRRTQTLEVTEGKTTRHSLTFEGASKLRLKVLDPVSRADLTDRCSLRISAGKVIGYEGPAAAFAGLEPGRYMGSITCTAPPGYRVDAEHEFVVQPTTHDLNLSVDWAPAWLTVRTDPPTPCTVLLSRVQLSRVQLSRVQLSRVQLSGKGNHEGKTDSRLAVNSGVWSVTVECGDDTHELNTLTLSAGLHHVHRLRL